MFSPELQPQGACLPSSKIWHMTGSFSYDQYHTKGLAEIFIRSFNNIP